MYVRDLEGKEYVTMCTYTIDDELNGNASFEAILEPNKPNLEFLDKITEMWALVDDDDIEHKIIYVRKQGQGNTLHAHIRAVPLFYDDFSSQRVYEEYNQSMTANAALNAIFENSGYNFILDGNFEALEWEGLGGGETRLEMFKKWLNRSKAEFEIQGRTIYIRKLVGRDTSIMYRHRLNASNIVQEIDASELWTYAKGYADYEDGEENGWETAKLVSEYTSPLGEMIGIRHGPPIKDGRIKHKDVLDKQLKELVDNSLKISVTADIHDLTKQGYPIAQAKNGDRVFLIDERIGLKEEVRVVNRKITRDWRGRILDINLTFGSQSIVKRHQSNLRNLSSTINDLLEGKIKLPYNVLDNAVIEATKAIKNAQSELIFSENGGILAVDKNDPNNVVSFNSAGVGVSTDGGKTFRNAMTGQGLVADVITSGTLRSIVVDAVNITGSHIEGSTFISRKSSTDYIQISGSQLVSRGRHQRDWFDNSGMNDVRIMIDNGQLRARNDTKDWSLYFNDWGMSTFRDGSGDAYDMDPSGYIEFHSTRYHSSRGLTIGSGARLALETTGGRIYINPNGASVRIADANDNYYSIHASNFSQSSRKNLKRDIKRLEDDALSLIRSLEIKEYKRLTMGEATIFDRWQAGILVEEAPPELLVDGDSIDLYTYINYIARAIQQLDEKIGV